MGCAVSGEIDRNPGIGIGFLEVDSHVVVVVVAVFFAVVAEAKSVVVTDFFGLGLALTVALQNVVGEERNSLPGRRRKVTRWKAT